MRHRFQRGMTLVELLVAMAIMSVVLVALSGVLYDVTRYYQGWSDRIADASTGGALATAIQGDSNRWVPCRDFDHETEMDFCVPGASDRTAAYTVSRDGATYSIFRQDLSDGSGGKKVLLARGVPRQPSFWTECHPAPGTVWGHIHVYSYRTTGGTENFSVYYHAPRPYRGTACSS